MNARTYTVTGPCQNSRAPERLRANETYTGDGFAVLMYKESQYWPPDAKMQATVILDHQRDDTATVKYRVGGGAVGVLKLTWGSESKVGKRFARRVVRAFDDLDLEWTRETGT